MDSLVHRECNLGGASIDRAEALRYVGHTGQQIDDALDARIDELIERCMRTSKPAFVYRIFTLSAPAGADDAIHLPECGIALTGADIRAHLAGACAVAVLACTAGLSNEQEMVRLSNTNGLDALLYSAAGSSLVESVADICEARIAEDAAAAGLVTNSRFSPGYGDLPLALQPVLMAALDAPKQLGISVTESNLLIPTKSTTALIGLFDHAENVHNAKLSCSTCSCSAHCTLRKAGTPCFL